MKEIIDVVTGEVKACNKNCILVSHAIGSCIVVTAWDPKMKVGAMAHIMLSGRAPEKRHQQRTRYAEDAIEMLLQLLVEKGVSAENLQVCLIGGGNVLKKTDDNICRANLKSVESLLMTEHIAVRARSVGGTDRRSARIDNDTGSVYYTVGNSNEMLLWQAFKK